MNSRFLVNLLAAALVLVVGAPVVAQTTNRIAGVVRDETGSPIRGAIVLPPSYLAVVGRRTVARI